MKIFKTFFLLVFPFIVIAQNQLTLVKDISPGYNKEFGIYFELNTDGKQLYLRSRHNGIYRFDPDSKNLNKIKNSYAQKYIPPYHSSGTIRNGEFYFVHNDEKSTGNIYKTIGDSSVKITGFEAYNTINPSRFFPPAPIVNVNQNLVFAAKNHNQTLTTIYSLDPDDQLVALKGDVTTWNFLKIRDKVIFLNESNSGTELWLTDGSQAGTFMVKKFDFYGETFININELNNNIYFFISNNQKSELWKTDLSAEGTIPVGSLSDSMDITSVSQSLTSGNYIYFAAYHPETGKELYKTNGTIEGISLVSDLYTGPESSNPSGFTAAGNLIYFKARNEAGIELWRTDGTSKGTRIVKDLDFGPGSSDPESMIFFQNKLFFRSKLRALTCMWESDGTEDGTKVIATTVTNNIFFPYSYFSDFIFLNNQIFYSASIDGITSLFSIKSGNDQPEKVIEFNEKYPNSSYPVLFSNIGINRYFYADGGLWVTQGNEESTRLIKQLDLFIYRSSPSIDEKLYFWGKSKRRNDIELWRTDGTANGTFSIGQYGDFYDDYYFWSNLYKHQDFLFFLLIMQKILPLPCM